MPQSENKTKPTKQSVTSFIKTLPSAQQREAKELVAIFKDVTKAKPVMWGNIFGFGQYHYKYESGREGDFLATGFAMRKSGPTIYIMPGYNDYSEFLEKLGPHKLGKSCLYLKSLEGIHQPTLKKLIKAGLRDLKKTYPVTIK
jgi:hypothetical protein